MSRLTPAMQHILDRMRDGWEVRRWPFVRLAHADHDSERVNGGTMHALERRGLVRYQYESAREPFGVYELTDAGKSA